MAGQPDHRSGASEHAARAVKSAWTALPQAHRNLLCEVGASQWTVVEQALGPPVHRLLRSAGLEGLSERERDQLERALAVWVPVLRLVAFNAHHPALSGLSASAFERLIARTAWHEWGHALSIVRCTSEDIASGARLIELAPTSVRTSIRAAGYRPYQYTHELVAEIYALLIERHRRDELGRPRWLNQEIYDLVKRVCGWPG